MEQTFWQGRWEAGETKFHLPEVNPQLVRLFERWLHGKPDSAAPSVLVPMCGKTLDLAWLAERGCRVRGVEFVELAVVQLFAQHLWSDSIELRDGSRVHMAREAAVEVFVGDFFAVTPRALGPCDAIYDRAALIAVEPRRRNEYVAKLAELAMRGSRLFLITLEHDLPSGPPFSVSADEVHELLAPNFVLEPTEVFDVADREPRFRERGATFVRERTWLGTRR